VYDKSDDNKAFRTTYSRFLVGLRLLVVWKSIANVPNWKYSEQCTRSSLLNLFLQSTPSSLSDYGFLLDFIFKVHACSITQHWHTEHLTTNTMEHTHRTWSTKSL